MDPFADKQTLEDLNIPGKYTTQSIFSLFNHTYTHGGERILENMFSSPLSDPDAINKRSGVFDFFAGAAQKFPFEDKLFGAAERYLNKSGGGGILSSYVGTFRRKIMKLIANDREYDIVAEGMAATAKMLVTLDGFVEKLLTLRGADCYRQRLSVIRDITSGKNIEWCRTLESGDNITFVQMARYDYLLRSALFDNMKSILNFVYELDVNISVGKVMNERGFVSAKALPRGRGLLAIEGVYHPQLAGAVANDIRIDSANNVFFLTGANMAGKSTFMKSLGIAVYLAHMGFPVAARSMEFAVLDGMFSSINVADNLNLGYSHFYAEVLRVKKVAEAVGSAQNLLVIFDELFKGTNVKDAYEASVAVTKAFSLHRNSVFVVSTHITEAGDALKAGCVNMQLYYMPTEMEGNKPTYPYKLRPGISADRHGMMIINNEHILDIIRGSGDQKSI